MTTMSPRFAPAACSSNSDDLLFREPVRFIYPSFKEPSSNFNERNRQWQVKAIGLCRSCPIEKSTAALREVERTGLNLRPSKLVPVTLFCC